MEYMQLDSEVLELAVRAQAKERPEHIYIPDEGGQSFYARKKMSGYIPDCIIGHALAACGVPIEQIAELDKAQEGEAYYTLLQFGINEDVREWCNMVQRLQDNGTPWDVAIVEADRTFSMEGLGRGE